MKNKLLCTGLLLLIFLACGCTKENTDKKVENTPTQSNKIINNIKVIINEKEYTLNLDNNETSKSFLNILPKEFKMNELNGNEKYYYFDKALPSNPSKVKYINKGDVMLYGDNCLVIFYKSFETEFSYTKIGSIENLPNLGKENINVKFVI